MEKGIPKPTVVALSRSIYKETCKYGFTQLDLVRLINELMDLCSNADTADDQYASQAASTDAMPNGESSELPLQGERVRVRRFDYAEDSGLFDAWLQDRYGRYFLLSAAQARSATIEELDDSDDNHLAIITSLDDTPIGAVAYLDHRRRRSGVRNCAN